MRRAELVTAALLVVAGLGALGVLIPRYVVGAPAGIGVSPRFMPYMAATLATAAALHLLGSALLRRKGNGHAAVSSLDSLWFACAAAAVLGGSYFIMARLGYLPGAAVLVAGLLVVARANFVTIVVTAVAAPVVLWATFAWLLATPLP